ncbi:MAG: T9SS type A sorting domain-containing protein [Chitinophagales bacterium]
MRKTLPFLLVTLFLAASVSAQWIEEPTGFATASRGINQIVITSHDNAWATAYNGSGSGSTNVRDFTRTTDGGATWVAGTVTAAPTNYSWSCLSAVDENTAWAMFYKNTSTATGGIYKTTDGGTSWTQQGAGVIFTTSSISFPDVLHFWDANTGVAVGDPVNNEFEIYYTSDGGATWTAPDAANIPDAILGEYGYTRVFAVSDDIFWFGTNNGRIFKTTDHGVTWSAVQVTGLTDLVQIDYKDENLGWAKYIDASSNVTFMRTTDGGATWTQVNPSGTMYKGDFCYVPQTDMTLVSTGVDFSLPDLGSSYSLDGGDTWVTIDDGIQYTSVNFYDNITGWAGGFNIDATTGGIFKYDGGFVATGIAPVATDYSFKLYPNPSDGLFYISFDAENNLPINIQITDAMGKLVMQTSYKDKSQLWLKSIDMRNFQNGVYFLKIENNGVETMRKLIVQ